MNVDISLHVCGACAYSVQLSPHGGRNLCPDHDRNHAYYTHFHSSLFVRGIHKEGGAIRACTGIVKNENLVNEILSPNVFCSRA